jgi:hypothetical protein
MQVTPLGTTPSCRLPAVSAWTCCSASYGPRGSSSVRCCFATISRQLTATAVLAYCISLYRIVSDNQSHQLRWAISFGFRPIILEVLARNGSRMRAYCLPSWRTRTGPGPPPASTQGRVLSLAAARGRARPGRPGGVDPGRASWPEGANLKGAAARAGVLPVDRKTSACNSEDPAARACQ